MKAAGEALKPIKGLKKAGKADEAGEALKAKPAKVRRLEREQRARERRDVFFLPSIFCRLPHKFFLTSFSFLFSHLTQTGPR